MIFFSKFRTFQRSVAGILLSIVIATALFPGAVLGQEPAPGSPEFQNAQQQVPAAQSAAQKALDAQAAEQRRADARFNASAIAQAQAQGLECGTFEFMCEMLFALNWFLDKILQYIMPMASTAFQEVLAMNITAFSTGPGGFIRAPLNTGWRTVLGIVNMFFILWILWIAIATIFDLDLFTGRKMLLRVVIAALLINFSLAIGTAIVTLGNNIGAIFFNAIIDRDKSIPAAIERATNPYPIIIAINQVYERDTNKAKAIIASDANVGRMLGFGSTITIGQCFSARDSLNNPGIMDIIRGALSVSLSALSNAYTVSACAPVYADASLAAAFRTVDEGKTRLTNLLAITLAAKVIIVPVSLFILIAATIFLLVRMVSLFLLLVFAPLAFFSLAIPQIGTFAADVSWSGWWGKLLKWTFYLPAFLFLFLLSITLLQNLPEDLLNAAIEDKEAISIGGAFVYYVMGIGMLIASLLVAQKLGIATAGTVIAFGKRWSDKAQGWAKAGIKAPPLWAGRKVAGKARSAIAPLAHKLESGEIRQQPNESKEAFEKRKERWQAGSRFLGRIPGVRRGLQRVRAWEPAAYKKAKADLDEKSSEEIQRLYPYMSQTNKDAAIDLLQSRRDLAPTEIWEEYTDENGKKAMRRTGRYEENWTPEMVVAAIRRRGALGEELGPLRRAVPHLLDNTKLDENGLTEMDRAIRSMRVSHIETLDPAAFNSDVFMEKLFQHGQRELFSRIPAFNPGLGTKIDQWMARNPSRVKAGIEAGKNYSLYDYLIASAREGYGYSLPNSLMPSTQNPRPIDGWTPHEERQATGGASVTQQQQLMTELRNLAETLRSGRAAPAAAAAGGAGQPTTAPRPAAPNEPLIVPPPGARGQTQEEYDAEQAARANRRAPPPTT